MTASFTPTGKSGRCSMSNAGPDHFLIRGSSNSISAIIFFLYSMTSALSWPSVNQHLEALVAVKPKYFIHLSAVLTLTSRGAFGISFNKPHRGSVSNFWNFRGVLSVSIISRKAELRPICVASTVIIEFVLIFWPCLYSEKEPVNSY